MRQQTALVLQQIDFVDHQQTGQPPLANLLQHHGILFRPGCSIDHEYHQVDIAHGGCRGPVHVAIDCLFRALVKPRCVDKNSLVSGLGLDSECAVPGGLRLARGDTDFLAQQVIKQG